MPRAVPRVVIVGGGFGGLAAAKALRKTNAQVILIDRQNHHLFQPLLYLVATSVLTPGQIASPIRGILRNQQNVTVILGGGHGCGQGAKVCFRKLRRSRGGAAAIRLSDFVDGRAPQLLWTR